MFGNKYSGDEIAKSFQKSLTKIKEIKKQASQEEKSFDAKDFLIDEKATKEVDSTMDNLLKDLSSYAKDSCAKCGSMHNEAYDCKAKDMHSSMAKDKSSCAKCGSKHNEAYDCKADDKKAMKNKSDDCPLCKKSHSQSDGCMDSSLALDHAKMNHKAQYVLTELSKVANSLRKSGKGFAADMVQATAIEIKKEELMKSAKKSQVVSELTKLAKESYQKGDRMTSDVILATINSIKKG